LASADQQEAPAMLRKHLDYRVNAVRVKYILYALYWYMKWLRSNPDYWDIYKVKDK
jgi:hypothetical protein